MENVRHLRLCQPNPARIEADLRGRHERDPLLYGIGLLIVLFASLTALGIYYANLDVKQSPWVCPDDGSSAMVAGYFEFGRLQDAQGLAPRCVYAGLLFTVIALFIISFVARIKP